MMPIISGLLHCIPAVNILFRIAPTYNHRQPRTLNGQDPKANDKGHQGNSYSPPNPYLAYHGVALAATNLVIQPFRDPAHAQSTIPAY